MKYKVTLSWKKIFEILRDFHFRTPNPSLEFRVDHEYVKKNFKGNKPMLQRLEYYIRLCNFIRINHKNQKFFDIQEVNPLPHILALVTSHW